MSISNGFPFLPGSDKDDLSTNKIKEKDEPLIISNLQQLYDNIYKVKSSLKTYKKNQIRTFF